MQIADELIEAVRALSPIEQVVRERVQLRRSGVQLMGRCPFHADKKPSFSVHPGKQLFYCHGCGAGGDVFEFVARIERTNFPGAAKSLAARAGISLQGVSSREAERLRSERKREDQAAARLLQLERTAFFEARSNCLQLESICRLAARRLRAIHHGNTERFSGEEEFGWFALADVSAQMPRAAAAYTLMSFGSLDVRVRFALHPEDRDALIEDALAAGFVANEQGHRHEVIL